LISNSKKSEWLIFYFHYFDISVYLLETLSEAQSGIGKLNANTWSALRLQKFLSYFCKYHSQNQQYKFDFLHHELTAYLSLRKNFLNLLSFQTTEEGFCWLFKNIGASQNYKLSYSILCVFLPKEK